jgi:hypothetical protein
VIDDIAVVIIYGGHEAILEALVSLEMCAE